MPDSPVRKKLEVPKIPDSQLLKAQKWVEGRINQGMVTMVEASNLQPEQMQLVQNARVRYDLTTRRPACKLFLPDKPDTNPVLGLIFTKDKLGNENTIRLTPSSINLLTPSAWIPLTLTPALNGTAADRFQFVDILDTFVLANNGADPLRMIDFGTNVVSHLGNAPAYRYVTGFFNRVVGFALRGINEAQVGWSGDGVAVQFDPTIDETAGNAPLVESPSDLSDFIKGGFGFTNIMVILREKSVWLATKQPIPTQPFYFYTGIPGIGCDCPFSAQIISNGLAWVDTRTKTVYAYSPGGALEAIGRPIEKTLLDQVSNPDTVFASYDAVFNEYTVFIPSSDTLYIRAWTFNFNTKAWTYNEYYAVTSAHSTELALGGNRIRDLTGTIAGLTGTIAGLSPSTIISTARTYGRVDGTIMMEDASVNVDAPFNTLGPPYQKFPNGVPFNTILTSKTFKIPSNDIYIAQTVIEYQCGSANDTFQIEYSKDDGKTWTIFKQIVPTVFNQSQLLILRKMFRARRFTWRVTSNAAQFEILSYEVWVYPSGSSRR